MTVTQYPPAESILTTLTWVKTAGSAITSLSGNDDTGQSLAYTPGQELVYLNGVLLTRGTDYIATTGNTITGLSGITSGDNIKVYAASNYSLAAFPAASITGSIANSQLANNAITVNGISIPLGGSVTAGAINSIIAGTGLTGGGTTGAVTIGLNPSYVIPAQSGKAGYYLTTDGVNLYWTNSNVIPSQTGNGGKFLQTDGNSLTWQSTAGILTNTFTGTQTINSSATSNTPLIVNGIFNQSADILQVRNSSASVLFKVDPSGNTTVGTPTIQNGSALTVAGSVTATSFFGPLVGGETNVSTITTATNIPANTATKIADFGNLANGLYAVGIAWPGGYTQNGAATIYWDSYYGAVTGIAAANVYYNSSPSQPLAVNNTQHHRNVSLPTFAMYSDGLGATNGSGAGSNYGHLCLWVTFPQLTYVQPIVYVKRLI
jgi:hypothetical protein